ncbi:MAG: 3-alpha-hydroxysteroid dehydrogenase [Porticoccaceae bacterium]|nr:3-alpha-hydroxysteroid dehydrogenase [Porticoccaceae bacterium]
MKVMGKLNGRVAIVTGAAQGIGEAISRAFIESGARVVMTDVKADQGRSLASQLGDGAHFIEQDVSISESWRDVVQESERVVGPVDILVNNAGIVGVVTNTLDFKEEDYNRIIGVNQNAVFFGMQAVIPGMLKNGGGSIVNISSIAGFVAVVGCPQLAYVCSKFAVRGMTKHVAVEYGDKNIRVNSICPGYVKTPMNEDALDEAGYEAVNLIPMKRFGEAIEVAKLAVFLASDDASFITGTEHVIDGGMIAC